MSLRNLLQKEWPLLLLFAIGLAVCLTNYKPGTFLSGWDTLHPEFDFALNIQRAFFGVFQPQQGLGAVVAHSHMADLPHILLVGLFSFFFPTNTLRYLFIFSCYLIGPLGMYVFLVHILPKRSSAFLGALFYMLSTGTIQTFYVPFEMFTVQYAALPWLFFFATDFLLLGNRKSYIGFCITIIFSSPMAYAATLWYVTFFIFCLYIGTLFLFTRKNKRNYFLRIFLLIGIFLVLNLYWILPNLYFIIFYGHTVINAASNQLFSHEAFLYNKAFGNIQDIALLRIFYFDWSIYTQGAFTKLMQPWITFLNNPAMLFVGFLFFTIAVCGVIGSMIRHRTILLSFFPAIGISLIFLLNDNLPFHLYNLLTAIPFFQEAFRFPDDKILGVFLFLYALFFAVGIQILTTWFSEKRLISFMSFAIILSMLPVFTGHFISPAMRIHIPQEYFDLFSYMQQQPEGRIATFPIDSPWGWEYYQWQGQQQSFQGSGFLWFGIPQPLMDRNYDRWNTSNEDYYQQMSYAVYAQNPTLFNEVLKKYDISYVLLDTSIISPGYNPKVLFYSYLKKLLAQDKGLMKKASFGNDITLFQTQFSSTAQVVGYQQNLPIITTHVHGSYIDSIYSQVGDYSSLHTRPSIQFPFAALTDNLQRLPATTVTTQPSTIQLTSNFLSPTDLFSPSFLATQQVIPSSVLFSVHAKEATISIYPSTPLAKATEPIVRHIPLPSTKAALALSIGDSHVITFLPTPITQTYTLGTIWLNTKEDNISLFDLNTAKTLPLNLTQQKLTVQPCLTQDRKNIFGIRSIQPTSLSLFAKDTLLCVSFPLASIVPPSSISKGKTMLVTTSYTYAGQANSTTCIAEAKTGSCHNTILTTINTGPQEAAIIHPADIVHNMVQIRVDTPQQHTFEDASYKNIHVTLAAPIWSSTIAQSDMVKAFQQEERQTIPALPTQAPFTFPQNSLTQTTTNDCFYNPLLAEIRSYKITKKETNYIEYQATDGSFCDHLSFTNLLPNQSYLLAIQSRNVSGLPLRLCISQPDTGRCDVLTKLPPQKQFATTYIVIPPLPTTHYDVNIDNLAISPTTTINDVSSISLFPFPSVWLSQISTAHIQKTTHLFEPLPFQTFFNSSIVVTSFPHTSNATLRLSESYDPGFVLYTIPSFLPFPLQITLPFLFGRPIGQHALIDSWANGWLLPSSSAATDHSLVIIFLPQYLEYLGLFVGSITLIATIWYLRK